MADHEPGGLELAHAVGDGGRLTAAGLSELCLAARALLGELEEQHLLAGVQAEGGEQCASERAVADADRAEGLVERVGLVEVHPVPLGAQHSAQASHSCSSPCWSSPHSCSAPARSSRSTCCTNIQAPIQARPEVRKRLGRVSLAEAVSGGWLVHVP